MISGTICCEDQVAALDIANTVSGTGDRPSSEIRLPKNVNSFFYIHTFYHSQLTLTVSIFVRSVQDTDHVRAVTN